MSLVGKSHLPKSKIDPKLFDCIKHFLTNTINIKCNAGTVCTAYDRFYLTYIYKIFIELLTVDRMLVSQAMLMTFWCIVSVTVGRKIL